MAATILVMSARGTAARLAVETPPPADAAEWERHKIVIAAAVAAIFGGGASIRAVRPVDSDNAWARQGRLALQSSHNLAKQRAGGYVLPARGVSNP